MPSFDVVSKIDHHELTNAIDQGNREIESRFDFKGSDAKYTLKDATILLEAPDEFQIKQMKDILSSKIAKRNLDLRSFTYKPLEKSLHKAQQTVEIQQRLTQEQAKKIVKLIKNEKLKVQATIQSDQVRISGKKKDDLQTAIAFLKSSELELPLQFENFRE